MVQVLLNYAAFSTVDLDPIPNAAGNAQLSFSRAGFHKLWFAGPIACSAETWPHPFVYSLSIGLLGLPL